MIEYKCDRCRTPLDTTKCQKFYFENHANRLYRIAYYPSFADRAKEVCLEVCDPCADILELLVTSFLNKAVDSVHFKAP